MFQEYLKTISYLVPVISPKKGNLTYPFAFYFYAVAIALFYMKLAFVIICCFPVFVCSGQESWTSKKDSLEHLLSREPVDSDKAWTMRDLGVVFLDHDQPDSAMNYAKALGHLSEKIHLSSGVAISLSMQAVILADANKLDEGIAMDLAAIEAVKKSGRPKAMANVFNNTAMLYSRKGEYTEALDMYMKALTAYEDLKDTSLIAMANGNIAQVYISLRDFKSAYDYSLRGIALNRHIGQTHGLTSALLNLSAALINQGHCDSALIVLRDDLELTRRLGARGPEISILTNMDYAYVGLGQFNLIKPTADKLMAVSLSLDNLEGQCYALIGLKYYYLDKKNYAKAEQATVEAINIARHNGLILPLLEAYKEAASVEMARGDQKRYVYYDVLRDSLDELMLNDKVLKNTKDIEGKYALHKKQAEIDVLNEQEKVQQLTLKQRMTTIWGLAALVLGIMLTGFFYYRNYQYKKRLLVTNGLLQEQRILELEKEKQLLATQAVLQGQVEERTRLAKDLHDGLGSILSSTKYSFAIVKENLVMSKENADAFDRSMEMLDKSISELRRVAHNMMPEALIKFGLDTALKDFCTSVDQSGALHLTYQSYDLNEMSIPRMTAASIYRIVQELVNNVIRHARASKALVQMIRKGDMLSIAVEDNGTGFDSAILGQNGGVGYLNLKNRVAYLNGTIDIETSPESGTSVNIEITNFLS
jgi:two-component system NarL family sensor kinase